LIECRTAAAHLAARGQFVSAATLGLACTAHKIAGKNHLCLYEQTRQEECRQGDALQQNFTK